MKEYHTTVVVLRIVRLNSEQKSFSRYCLVTLLDVIEISFLFYHFSHNYVVLVELKLKIQIPVKLI